MSLRRVLESARGPLLPKEILESMRQEMAGIGIATIYRNLRLLVDGGDVREVRLPGDVPRYRLAKNCHAAVVRCLECGRVFDAPGASVVLKNPGEFSVESYQLTLDAHCTGQCSYHVSPDAPVMSGRRI